MKDFIRVFGAFPIAHSDAGEVGADHDATVVALTLPASQPSKWPVAGVAFTRTIDLIVGLKS